LVAADGGVLIHAAEVAHPAQLALTPAGEEDGLAGFAPVAPGGTFLMGNLLILAALLADALAVPLVLLLADLAEAGAAPQTYLRAGGFHGQGPLIASLAVAEALSDNPLMLHADLLHAGFALVAFWLLPGPVVANGGVRAALRADHQEVLAFYLMVLQELLDDAAGDGGGVDLGTHHALQAEVAVVPEDCAEF
jgi:hypothetical protein